MDVTSESQGTAFGLSFLGESESFLAEYCAPAGNTFQISF